MQIILGVAGRFMCWCALQATALHRSVEGGPRGRFQQQVLQFAHGSIATTIVVRTNQGLSES